jgi:NADH-quinone oxidoreductase subunit C
MADVTALADRVKTRFPDLIEECVIARGELTVEVKAENLRILCLGLRDEPEFDFALLMDVCGVDYLNYGVGQWETTDTTLTGFSRGVETQPVQIPLASTSWRKARFAAVYHLLSIKHNHRIRLRTFPLGEPPIVPSVIDIWESANWFEREAFDLYGILFDGHPDLRRILTDYGFIGHPFRKDFPLIGNVEVRYDAAEGRVIYEPVSIEARTLVPKVIRDDSRYIDFSQTDTPKPPEGAR